MRRAIATSIAPSHSQQLASIDPTTRNMVKAAGTAFAAKAPTSPGFDIKEWIDSVARDVGSHPTHVLQAAFALIKRTCRFWPTTAEIVDAILKAYGSTGSLMSPDGELLYRERQDAGRFIGGPDGRRRFVGDLKLASLGFGELLTGHDGNRILDAIPEALVEDVETAAVNLAEISRCETTAAKLAPRWRRETRLNLLERLHRGARTLHWIETDLEPSGTARYVAILGESPVPSRTLTLDKRARELLEQVEKAREGALSELYHHLNENYPYETLLGEQLLDVIRAWAEPIIGARQAELAADPLIERFDVRDGQFSRGTQRDWYNEPEAAAILVQYCDRKSPNFRFHVSEFNAHIANRDGRLAGRRFLDALENYLGCHFCAKATHPSEKANCAQSEVRATVDNASVEADADRPRSAPSDSSSSRH